MVDWNGRKPCRKRFDCVETEKNNAAVSGQEFKGLSTEVCSACTDYSPEPPQGMGKGRTKFF